MAVQVFGLEPLHEVLSGSVAVIFRSGACLGSLTTAGDGHRNKRTPREGARGVRQCRLLTALLTVLFFFSIHTLTLQWVALALASLALLLLALALAALALLLLVLALAALALLLFVLALAALTLLIALISHDVLRLWGFAGRVPTLECRNSRATRRSFVGRAKADGAVNLLPAGPMFPSAAVFAAAAVNGASTRSCGSRPAFR
ncbi:MAG: hypothetical protein KY442_00035 [Proteobacteria bacterium]|nr:hypothetical protein [Pseudomonadota bacterium]